MTLRSFRSAHVVGALAALASVVGFTTVAQAASLPKAPAGRTYEQVSPSEKRGVDVAAYAPALSAPDGNTLVYQAQGAFAGNLSNFWSNQYRAVRGPTGWTSTNELPPFNNAKSPLAQLGFIDYSDDLSRGILRHSDPVLTDDASPDNINLYVRDVNGTTRLVNRGDRLEGYFDYPGYDAASSDMSHVLYTTSAKLTDNAHDNQLDKLYEWVDGTLRLVGVDVNGDPLPNSNAGAGPKNTPGANGGVADLQNTISRDGRRVFFTYVDPAVSTVFSGDGRLFLRQDGVETVEISASQRPISGPDPSGPQGKLFWTASDDGSRAFFTSPEKLTEDSDACGGLTPCAPGHSGELGDLYMYNADTKMLTDLTPGLPNGGAVREVVGTSRDGRYVYFVSNERIGGAPTRQDAVFLYVWHDGQINFVNFVGPAQPVHAAKLYARISQDGRRLVYATQRPGDGLLASVLFEYDADTRANTCVSCLADGAFNTEDATFRAAQGTTFIAIDNRSARNVTDDGARIFFDTAEALVPADINGVTDPYMYEHGKVTLISTGKSPTPSYFMEASSNGEDVFFATREQLVSSDNDTNVDVYDARVEGRVDAPSVPVMPCIEDACQGRSGATPARELPAAFGTDDRPSISTRASVTLTQLTAAQRAQVIKTGRLTLKVHVTGAGRLILRAVALIGGRKVSIAQVASVVHTGSVRISLRFSNAAMRHLALARKLVVTISASLAGATKPSSRTVTLHSPRPATTRR